MIEHTLNKEKSVLHVRATGPLSKSDFDALAGAVDPHIEQAGSLDGLILETARFPGWEDLAAVARHFRFVRDHHRKIKKVAIVTDSPFGNVAEHIAAHFVAAEIKHFGAGETESAEKWVASE